MTILVTGANGFTGGTLAKELVRRGFAVRAFVRPGRDTAALETIGIEIVRGDIRDEAAVMDAARGCEVIYHIAAVFRTAGHPESVYRHVNIGGTANVIAAARQQDVKRLVHCSTVGVHGHIAAKNIPADESAPLEPGDLYQRSKLDAERLVQQVIAEGMPATVFRPSGIYGPGDMRFLKLFRTINNGKFRMFGSGRVLYHLTYIDDLVDGIIRCGERIEAIGQTYILAGPRYSTLSELVEKIAQTLGVQPPLGNLPLWPLLTVAMACEWTCVPLGIDPPLHRRRADFFRKDRAFSIEKATRELGFDPKIDLEEGLARTARWYFEHGCLDRRWQSVPEEAVLPPLAGGKDAA